MLWNFRNKEIKGKGKPFYMNHSTILFCFPKIFQFDLCQGRNLYDSFFVFIHLFILTNLHYEENQYMYLAGWMSGIETGRSWSLSETELQLLWIQGYIVHSPAVWQLKWSKKPIVCNKKRKKKPKNQNSNFYFVF